jgi:hypothetical protein
LGIGIGVEKFLGQGKKRGDGRQRALLNVKFCDRLGFIEYLHDVNY